MKRLSFLTALLIPMLSFAQSNFQKGYIVTPSLDTLKGYINYKERVSTPSDFKFRTDPGAEVKTFDVQNCNAVVIDGKVTYKAYDLKISMSSENENRLSTGPDTTSKNAKVFLQLLRSGENITLFRYTDAIKNRFYILENDKQQPYELIKMTYFLPNSKRYVVDNKFVEQFKEVLVKYNAATEENQKKLSRLDYYDNNMIQMVSLINNETKSNIEASSGENNIKRVRFFAGAGVIATNTKFAVSSYQNIQEKSNSKVNYQPFITAGVDLFINPAIGDLIFRAAIEASKNKYENMVTYTNSTEISAIRTFEQFLVNVSPQVIYNVYNKPMAKVFVAGGFLLNFASYKNGELERNYNSVAVYPQTKSKEDFGLGEFYYSLFFKAGVVLNKRFELYGSYALPSKTRANDDFSLQTSRIGFNYLFGKH